MAVTYEQHKEFLRMVSEGAAYELFGFMDAYHSEPLQQDNPRYMQGWNDGKAKLMQDQQRPATTKEGDE